MSSQLNSSDSKTPFNLIKKDLQTLTQFSNFLMFLGKEMDTEGEITLRSNMLVTIADRLDMAVDSIYYELDPKWDEERAASRREGAHENP